MIAYLSYYLININLFHCDYIETFVNTDKNDNIILYILDI